MGIYINPKDDIDARSKGPSITSRATAVSSDEFRKHKPGQNGKWGVVLIDNGFIAAGVAFSLDEAAVFSEDRSNVMGWYLMDIEKIRELDPSTAKVLDDIVAKRG